MTVCGGPREENPMCVEENPTGSDCCCMPLAQEVSSSSTSEAIIA